MIFLSLVSGGKDSVYSLVKAIQHGHTCRAIANLFPPGDTGAQWEGTMSGEWLRGGSVEPESEGPGSPAEPVRRGG